MLKGAEIAGYDKGAWKQGSMYIPAAVFRLLQDICGQDQAISYDDHQVRFQLRNQVPGPYIPECGWLVYGDSGVVGKLFDGAGLQLPATAGGAVWLSQGCNGGEPLCNQSLQGWN